ncbi:MAG: 3'-5' exonuclease [Myxococcales bacterium]|nr:3'-5' exonuclease [Myxococcales bacterium]
MPGGPPTRLDAPWSDARFAVIDVEGNGARPHDLVELGVVPLDGGRSGSLITWLVRPEEPITARATSIHAITNAAVAAEPRFESVAEAVMSALSGRYLVAHNAGTDWAILRRRLPDFKPLGVIDTLKLARAMCPGRPSYGLDQLLAAFSLSDRMETAYGRRHRAGYDALAATHLFLHLAAGLPRGHLSLRDLLRLALLPASAPDRQRSLF